MRELRGELFYFYSLKFWLILDELLFPSALVDVEIKFHDVAFMLS